jgi:tetratricopeptide (TPR) repeat protein
MSFAQPQLGVEIRKLGNKFFAITKQDNGREICTNEFQHDPTGTTHLGPLWLLERGVLPPDERRATGGKAGEEHAAQYGQRLYTYLFGKGKQLRSFLKNNPDYRQAHLVLSLHPDVASLWRLPWEYLHDGDKFVCLDGESRYSIALRLSRLPADLLELSPRATRLPLRVLFVIAAPDDQKALDVERELTVMQDALEDHIRAGNLVMDVLDEATLLALQSACGRQHQGAGHWHVIHYIGHGTYSHKQQRGFLCFEKPNGETDLLEALHLRSILDGSAPRLWVISACQSAQIGVLDAFDNVATGLLQFGAPAVLTVPTSLTDDSAIELAHTFYGHLAAGRRPIESLYQARLALSQLDADRPVERRRFDWGVPALYLRAHTMQLVDHDMAEEAAEATGATLTPAIVRNVAGLTLPYRFVDRQQTLHTLRNVYQESARGTGRALYVWGSSGSGKTTLVAQSIVYSGIGAEDVCVINCRELLEPVSALGIIADFWRSRQHSEAAALLLDKRRDPAERAHLAAQSLSAYPHILVFDGLDAWFSTPSTDPTATPGVIADKTLAAVMRGLLFTRGSITYLFTAPQRWADVTALPGDYKREIQLDPLTQRYAVLLMDTLPHLGQATLAAKMHIYRLLGGHPQTLHLLEGWLAAGHELQTLFDHPPVQPQATEAWQHYFLGDIVRALDPGEDDALTALMVFEGAFGAALLTRLTRITEKYAAPLLERWEKLALLQVHHIEQGRRMYTFHPIVRRHILDRVQADEDRIALHARLATYYGTPFMDEARRRVVARNADAWSPERVAWLARDSNGILGMWVRQTQDPEQARRTMDEALAWQHHLFKAGDVQAAAHIIRTIVPVLNRWGQHDLSEALLQRSIAVNAGPERGPSMDDLATLYLDRGHLNEALKVYEEVYQMFAAQGAREQMAHILRRIARAHQQLSNHRQAIETYEAALQIMREIGDENGQSACLHQLATIHRQMGDYQRALACSQATEQLQHKLGNLAGAAAALYEQALILKHINHLDSALDHWQQSFDMASTMGDEIMAVDALREMSTVYRESGRLNEAIEASLKAVEMCYRANPRKAANLLQTLGKLYEQQGDAERAAASYAQARRMAQQ